MSLSFTKKYSPPVVIVFPLESFAVTVIAIEWPGSTAAGGGTETMEFEALEISLRVCLEGLSVAVDLSETQKIKLKILLIQTN